MSVQAVHENPAFNERVNAAAQHPPVAPKKAMRLFGDAIFCRWEISNAKQGSCNYYRCNDL